MAELRWLTGFLDLPAARFEEGLGFWAAVTGTAASPRRGPDGRFATLVPRGAEGCWRVQRLDRGGPGMHLDLHGDLHGIEQSVRALGATLVERFDDVTVLRSPAGLPFCAVADPPEDVSGGAGPRGLRPAPVDWGGHASMLDQVCLDVPAADVDREVDFWAAVIGSEASVSTRRPEFVNLPRPAHLPLRLLVQRLEDGGPVRAHPDLASTDRSAEVARLVTLGATVDVVEEFWTVLRAPDGRLFCVTERDPATGHLN